MCFDTVPTADRWFRSTTAQFTSPTADASVCTAKKLLSTVFAGQAVGINEAEEGIWLVSFMGLLILFYDLGYIDLEEKTL
jgi:hypothetical protein